MTISYQIEIYSFWHIGSGLTGGASADNLVNKNEEYLPFIPGKTIKGLLREAATVLNQLDESNSYSQFIKDVFGDDNSSGVSNSLEGKAFFYSAELSQNLSKAIVNEKLAKDLYQVISSTAINEFGQAIDGSLRQLEVTVPLLLYGIIEHFPENDDDNYIKKIENCFKWVKHIGVNRNRGLGRCNFSKI
jgi:CRISPR/Cas system CSM-associated protein Csm3 (group 7 of RAMP superfamily)